MLMITGFVEWNRVSGPAQVVRDDRSPMQAPIRVRSVGEAAPTRPRACKGATDTPIDNNENGAGAAQAAYAKQPFWNAFPKQQRN